MTQVTGRVFISLNGKRIRSKEGASLELGGIAREAAASDAGVDGHTEKIVPPKVDSRRTPGLSLRSSRRGAPTRPNSKKAK
jgi:Phage tail tube protein